MDLLIGVFTVIGGLAACSALLVAAIAAYITGQISLENQRSNVIIHCNSRYDELYRARLMIDVRPQPSGPMPNVAEPVSAPDPAATAQRAASATKEEMPEQIEIYFRRYWGLQSDQIDHWIAGYLDPETLSSWLMSTVNNLKSSMIGQYTYKDGWLLVRTYHRIVNPTLYRFCDMIIPLIELSETDDERTYAHVLRFLSGAEKHARPLTRKLSAVSFSRFRVDQLIERLPGRVQRQISEIESSFALRP